MNFSPFRKRIEFDPQLLRRSFHLAQESLDHGAERSLRAAR